MSNAKKCDRCGKFYSFADKKPERAKFEYDIKFGGGGFLHYLNLMDRYAEKIRAIDLCSECTQSFKSWIENVGQEDK